MDREFARISPHGSPRTTITPMVYRHTLDLLQIASIRSSLECTSNFCNMTGFTNRLATFNDWKVDMAQFSLY